MNAKQTTMRAAADMLVGVDRALAAGDLGGAMQMVRAVDAMLAAFGKSVLNGKRQPKGEQQNARRQTTGTV